MQSRVYLIFLDTDFWKYGGVLCYQDIEAEKHRDFFPQKNLKATDKVF